MYAQLGDIIFEGLKGITSWQEKASQTLTQHALIDSKPKLQKTGDALDEITLGMTFHRKFCNPETEIAKIKKHRLDGSILPLLTGVGELIGNFTIASSDVTVSHTGPSGLIVMSTVSVVLLEVADNDQLGNAIAAAKSSAFAVEPNSPLGLIQAKPFEGPGLSVAKSLKSADSHQAAGERALNQAKVNTPVQVGELRKANDSFKKVNESVDKFTEGLTKIRGTINNLEDIQEAAAAVKTYAQNTLDAIALGDIDAAIAANNDVRQGILSMSSTSSQIIVQTASRRI